MDPQFQFRGPRRLTCLDLLRDLVLERLSYLNLLRDPPIQGSQEVYMPRPAWGFDLQEAVMPQTAWGSAPDLGMPSSQVATVLGRISFRKTHP